VLVHEYDNLIAFLILCPLSRTVSLQAQPRNPVIVTHVFLTVRPCMFMFLVLCSKSPKHKPLPAYTTGTEENVFRVYELNYYDILKLYCSTANCQSDD
jgi:hypothetical protein